MKEQELWPGLERGYLWFTIYCSFPPPVTCTLKQNITIGK